MVYEECEATRIVYMRTIPDDDGILIAVIGRFPVQGRIMRAVRLSDILNQRDTILAIAERHGSANVRVFGSVARGDARDGSDIDFLVEMGSRHSPWFPSGLRLDLRELLGRDVDIVTERMLDTEIRADVLREAVAL